MPGLTKVATADQPASTVADIEKMAKKFIVSKNVVIVAVSAANADIATSDGVRVAKEVDPTPSARWACSRSWTSWTKARTRRRF